MRGWDGAEARRHWLFDPTCTISGLTSGYQGPGSKTVLPAEASAKVDFRLVPDQEPAEIIRLLRRHLDEQGFSDVEVVEIEGEGERASRTDPDAPIVGVVADVSQALSGKDAADPADLGRDRAAARAVRPVRGAGGRGRGWATRSRTTTPRTRTSSCGTTWRGSSRWSGCSTASAAQAV